MIFALYHQLYLQGGQYDLAKMFYTESCSGLTVHWQCTPRRSPNRRNHQEI